MAQTYELPDDHTIRTLQQRNLRENLEEVKNALPEQTKRATDLAAEEKRHLAGLQSFLLKMWILP